MARSRKKPKGSLSALSGIQSASMHPIYLLQGDDPFLREEYLRTIRRKVFGDALDDFNHDRLDWNEADASQIVTIAQTLPFIAQRRLVEILNFTSPGARDETVFLSYFDAPSDSTVLVFCAESVDMRRNFLQRLAAVSTVCHVDTPGRDELTRWLRGHAAELGFELRPEAADMLVEMVKPSMARLNSEIEKLASYLESGTSAGTEEIREVVGHSKEELLYKLGDSISLGRLGETLILLRRMMEVEHPVVFIGLLRNMIRRWTISKALARSERGALEISQTLGVPPFVAQKLEGQVRSLRSTYLRDLYAKLLALDRKMKRTGDLRVVRQTLELFLIDARLSKDGTRTRV